MNYVTGSQANCMSSGARGLVLEGFRPESWCMIGAGS